jgi:hypothetical protein
MEIKSLLIRRTVGGYHSLIAALDNGTPGWDADYY